MSETTIERVALSVYKVPATAPYSRAFPHLTIELAMLFARAAIETLREPSEGIMAYGARLCGDERGNPDETAFRAIWQNTLDAILSEPPAQSDSFLSVPIVKAK